MKAIRLAHIGQPLEMQDIPVPALGDDDVLVRVRAAGICHSDAHYQAGTSPVGFLPITLGHEVAGTVERIGARVRTVHVGDRVCVHYMYQRADDRQTSRRRLCRIHRRACPEPRSTAWRRVF